jgi:PAS domain S-box-containing protein
VLCRAGINPSGAPAAGEVIFEDEKGIMRDVIESGERIYLREAVKDPKWVDLEIDRDDPIGSYLGIPMRFQGRVIGALTCITPTPREFSEATLNAMSSLAAHAAIAIENSRLLTEARGRATTLEVLDEISRAINATLDLDELFQITARQVKRVVPCDRASLFILDADKREISQISSVDDVKKRQLRVSPANLEGTRFEEILRTLEPIYIPDTREDPHPRSRVLEAEGLRSIMNTPIVIQRECVGFLNVAAEAVDAFGDEHIQLLRWVADHLGAAIRNAELFARVRETGERLDRFVRSAADGIITVDLDGRITSWNPGAKTIYGYSEEELLGEHITRICPGGEREFKGLWRRLMAGESVTPFEVVRRRKDGTPVDVSITASAIKDPRGRIAGISGIHRDITERKRAELALERFRTILDQTGEAFYIIDAETGDFVDVNDTACRMLGYSRDELLVRGAKDIEVAHKIQTPEQWQAHVRRLRETGKTLIMEENVHRRKDGTSLPVEVSVSLQTFENRDYAVAVVRDITERKRSEEALKLTQFSIERAGDATCWIGPDGRFLYVNEAACNHLGYSREELLSMRVPDIDPGASGRTFPDNWERVKRKGFMTFETFHLTKDGRLLSVEISANYLEFAGKEYIFSFVRDITDRKQADEALQDLNRELGEKNKELETIVHVASHDLRSPLVTIQGYGEELAETCQALQSTLNGMGVDGAVKKELLSALEEKIPEFLHHIQSGASRIDSLLRGLLRVSRLGKATVSVDRLDMNAMMAEIAESLNDQIHETGADLRVENLPPCRGDTTPITQVFSNLVDNALKYRDPSRPPVIDISAREEEGSSVYCVKDNGIGVRPDLSERIFHRLKKSDVQGEGLGLTIARQIVARHNGKIWGESDPGEGNAFYVILPGGDKSKHDTNED